MPSKSPNNSDAPLFTVTQVEGAIETSNNLVNVQLDLPFLSPRPFHLSTFSLVPRGRASMLLTFDKIDTSMRRNRNAFLIHRVSLNYRLRFSSRNLILDRMNFFFAKSIRGKFDLKIKLISIFPRIIFPLFLQRLQRRMKFETRKFEFRYKDQFCSSI